MGSLAASIVLGPTGATAWVTSATTGGPVAGATVWIYASVYNVSLSQTMTVLQAALTPRTLMKPF